MPEKRELHIGLRHEQCALIPAGSLFYCEPKYELAGHEILLWGECSEVPRGKLIPLMFPNATIREVPPGTYTVKDGLTGQVYFSIDTEKSGERVNMIVPDSCPPN